ncbi:SAM-dependent methyltransferase [Limimaricola hongkongensis]|uniref:Cyclopropane-fatty-acyl-phospholipid synthase, plant type n=1 Tax=Limimaricola hongkongensis DSM 17492 TaxID=1122180 RepID=A0A017HDR6_9RHOB|nr:cyclopropane-fatty-acyl-phospholipid synthase family protein [Limimaricola hongkongensis]EYD72496.1 Cyclopropane-fatty-acyl-phospholipid synthase, plant type [Limimaricola hongkongensis DSM 17492]
MILTGTEGQDDLPRYFAQVFEMTRMIRHGRLDIVLPDGRRFRAAGGAPGPQAEIRIHDPDCFARLIREGDLGFSEAYVEGGWSSPDLLALLDLVHDEVEVLFDGFPGRGLLRTYERLRHWLRANTRAQARRNISHHYDLGNDFYALWLDPSMTYSSALFEGSQQSLEAAQRRKYESLVDRMGVRPDEHVLEIGCGWGGFAQYAAAERGLKVTGLTISREQLDYARARIARAGLSERVELQLLDYRDARGQYDGVASIEMFEAVGERYWPVYFDALRDRLRPGRQAALQVITLQDHRFAQYRGGVDFIQKYIFPGGMLPSPGVLRRLSEQAGLRLTGQMAFGDSYSRTLRQWHASFNARWDEVARLGFDARFRRMWNFYLCACASTFRSGNCDVTQFSMIRPA